MRGKEKAIDNLAAIETIIGKSLVCRLAFSEDDCPYVVPLCFGYQNKTLYFHSSPEGKKLEILKKNSKVCFEFDIDHEVVPDEKACKWSMRYRSVIGFGKASFVNSREEKKQGLDLIMAHYGGRSFDYPESAIDNTVVIKVQIERLTGKESGY
jgi:hypothetical protein